ncbi:hypothetical protein AB0E18_14120, partial [Streptomyces sp. NPDC047968]
GPGAPGPGEADDHGVAIAVDARSEGVETGQIVLPDGIEPVRQALALPSAVTMIRSGGCGRRRQGCRDHGPHEEDRAHVAGLMGEALSYEVMRAPTNRMRHHRGQRQAEQAQRPEDDPQRLFTEACLHGLKARLCDDVDSLDSYLPPKVAAMARRVAEALEVEVPEPIAT